MTYEEARTQAQARADETGYDQQLLQGGLSGEWFFRGLPAQHHRTGHELFAEVVMCSVLSRCQPGHGPLE